MYDCVLQNVFILCAGAWRAEMAMRSHLKERPHVDSLRMAAAMGALGQLQSNGDDMKLARVVRSHICNGVRRALSSSVALGDYWSEDEDACFVAALSFVFVLETSSDMPSISACSL